MNVKDQIRITAKQQGRKYTGLIIPILLGAMSILFLLFLHMLTDTGVFSPSYYNTYTRQAMAWRDGLLHLPENVEALELAVYQNEYYVSFPPVPSVIEWFLTFFFGMATPDNFLMMLYSVLSCECLYFFFRKNEMGYLSSSIYAFSVCFVGCILPMCLVGAVWYHAQLLAFAFICVSCLMFSHDHPLPALICYALSVGCRPFNAIYGIVLMLIYVLRKLREHIPFLKILKKMLPGIIAGLMIAAVYGWYNFIRFDNIFEFGHNWLPEFSTQGGVQFSLSHIPQNARTFLFGMPFSLGAETDTLRLNKFGFSVFIACPVITIMCMFVLKRIFTGKIHLQESIILLGFTLHFFLLLLHRTFGGYQFGARYTCDLLIYAALYFALAKKETNGFEIAVFAFSLIFSVYGTYVTCLF